ETGRARRREREGNVKQREARKRCLPCTTGDGGARRKTNPRTTTTTGDTPNFLPITDPSTTPTRIPTNKKMSLLPLIFLIYFEVAGGPYGEEPAVKAGGPLLAILSFLVFPFIWSVPEVLITAELSTAFPGNGGFLLGTWKFLSGVINIASFPVLCIDYLEKLFPVFASGLPRKLAILISTLFLSFVNYTGLAIVGYAAVGLGIVSLLPFIIMSLTAIPHIHPYRWVSLGQQGVKKDWNLFFNTLFWNLNFWDNVSTLAGEVEKPPWVWIILSTTITMAVSSMTFTDIISSANFLYSLGMLLEFASFVWLRRKYPKLKRPYRVPMRLPGLVIMCLIPSAFLIFIMAIATKTVYLVSGLMTVGAIGWYFLIKFSKSRRMLQFNDGDDEDE
ncbi:hypothetical protein RJ640_022440, partial [Escallonia rubra]